MSKVKQYLSHLDEIDRHEAAFRGMIADVTLGEFRVMALVNENPLRLKSMASTREVAAQGVGRVCERLRKRGLVQVARYQRDKREKHVTLTDEGKDTLKRCESALKIAMSPQLLP